MRHTPHTTGVILSVALLCCVPHSALAVDPAVAQAQRQRIEVVEKVAPSVVSVFATGGGGGGSGVLITADGYALSNFHVTSSCGDFMKCGLNDGVLYDAVIVGIDPTGDVALLKLLGREDFPFATLGDSDQVQVGDWAYAMGNPFLLATDFQPTVTYGIVSGVHRYQYPAGTFLEYTDCIQVDSSINPGNSGGPLFNAAGKLIGINGRGSFEKRGRVNSGAGYAISINQIKHFMDHLRSGRVVDHATLGATVTTDLSGAVVIDQILESSAAFRRGLRARDEIVSFAGRPIRSVNQFKNILGIYPKGWKLPLVYRADGQKHEVLVRLGGLHTQSELAKIQQKSQGPGPRPQRPRPGQEKPDEPEPGESPQTPDDTPEGPQDSPHAETAELSSAPKEYEHMFIARRGFANFYFNQLELDRVLRSRAELGDYSQSQGIWKIGGELNNNEVFELTLAEKGIGLQTPTAAYFQPLDGSDFLDEPPGTGGLLTAFHHCKLWLTQGAAGFTEFYYLGSEPLDGTGPKVDVLVSQLTGVETRWYFDRQAGTWMGFDTSLGETTDACEVRIGNFGEFEGRQFPTKLVVKYGEQQVADFAIETVTLSAGTRPAKSPESGSENE